MVPMVRVLLLARARLKEEENKMQHYKRENKKNTPIAYKNQNNV